MHLICWIGAYSADSGALVHFICGYDSHWGDSGALLHFIYSIGRFPVNSRVLVHLISPFGVRSLKSGALVLLITLLQPNLAIFHSPCPLSALANVTLPELSEAGFQLKERVILSNPYYLLTVQQIAASPGPARTAAFPVPGRLRHPLACAPLTVRSGWPGKAAARSTLAYHAQSRPA